LNKSRAGRRVKRVKVMVISNPSQLKHELENRVQVRTGRRVRDLAVEVGSGRIILKGRTSTYYVKQLAQHGVRDLLPHVPVENTIAVVDGQREVLAG
jgi:hypothetical protein